MSVNFEIYKNNLVRCDAQGNASVNISPNELLVPVEKIPYAPRTLEELVKLVGDKYIVLSYYVSARGTVSDHDCLATYTLYAGGQLSSGQNITKVAIAQTSQHANSGGSINSGWIALVTNTTGLLTLLTTNQECTGTGCGCSFENKGGWSNVNISLRIDVSVTMLNYCTATGTHNIYHDMCYHYVINYLTSTGPTPEISTYLQNYCAQKYPHDNLSIFNDPTKTDPKDFQICACNMPADNYHQYYKSLAEKYPGLNLGAIPANCFLPACATSPFKGINLNGCPVPTCFNKVEITKDNVIHSVQMNDQFNCSEYGIPLQSPLSPSSPYNSTIHEPSSFENFFQKNGKWLFIALAIFLILMIILLFIVLGTTRTTTIME